MKTSTRRGLLALLLVAAAVARAQMPPLMRGEAPSRGRPPARPDPLAELKSSLRLQPAQEAAWAAWTAAMAPRQPEEPPPRPAATTPERLEQMRVLREAMDAGQRRRDEATLAFYSALTPEQRAIFDRLPPAPPRPPAPRGPSLPPPPWD